MSRTGSYDGANSRKKWVAPVWGKARASNGDGRRDPLELKEDAIGEQKSKWDSKKRQQTGQGCWNPRQTGGCESLISVRE